MKKILAAASAAVVLLGVVLLNVSPATADIPGLEYIGSTESVQANAQTGYTLYCPTGKNAISGGYVVGSAVVDVWSSSPGVANTGSAYAAEYWHVGVKNLTGSSATVSLFVVCADIS